MKLHDPEISLVRALKDSVERWRRECPDDERLQEAAWIAGDLQDILEKVVEDPRTPLESKIEAALSSLAP
jgi:hypothetical protein